MTALTEGKHASEFILSEANGTRSRETGSLASGTVKAGGILMGPKSSATPLSEVGTAGVPDAVILGISINNVDASGGAQPCAYIARDAEVIGGNLTYPHTSTAGDDTATINTALTALGIIVR